MITTIGWQPDTCGCDLSLSHDSETETTTLAKVNKRCAKHDSLVDQALFRQVFYKDNRLKNQTLGFIKTNFPGIDVIWEFDEGRKLKITSPVLSVGQLVNIHAEVSRLETALDRIP